MSTDDPGTYTRRPKAEREHDGTLSLPDQAVSLSSSLRRLRTSIQDNLEHLEQLEQLERDRADAQRIVDEGGLDNSGLLALARQYARAVTPEQRDQLAASIATQLSVDEAGVILRAAAAVRTAVPGIVLRAKALGDSTAGIARELDMTDSYVRRIVREHRQVSWRLDLYGSEAGPEWASWEAGDDIIPLTLPYPALAERVLAEAGRGPREHFARVLIWIGTDTQPDDAAVYTHAHIPPSVLDDPFADMAAEYQQAVADGLLDLRYWRLERQWAEDGTAPGDWHTVKESGPVTGGRPVTAEELAAYLLTRFRRTQPPEARLRVTVWPADGGDTPGPDATTVYSDPQ
ncbi:hypothetical protein ACIF6K_26580 [Streptomyces sp. NPDC085942]|uniref:hypothetical protein n=1 Tax=Streptomyces sp. NPDC085942 TaxID=3365743 RepID=UPI0037CEAC04